MIKDRPKDVLDTLFGDWPSTQRTDREWDERAAATVKVAASGKPGVSAGLSDNALFAAPLARRPEELESFDNLEMSTQSSATSEGRLSQGTHNEVVEKKMSNPSDRSRDRSSFQDLAKMAATPSLTPPPAAVSSGARPAEAGKDDSGIVDLKAMAAADPGAEQRAAATPLAAAGLFDDAADVAAMAPAARSLTESATPPPPSTSVASPSMAVPSAVAAVAAPVKKDEKKKGGLVLLLGGIGAFAAVAAGGFFYIKTHKSAPPAPVAMTAPAVADKPAATATIATPAPTDSVAAVETSITPDTINAPDKNAMQKFKGVKPGTAVKPGANSATDTAPTSSADPKLVFNMPQTSGGTGTGDLDEEMRTRVGGKKGVDPSLTPASTGPSNVPQKPSQGQVAGAINVVLPAARGCLSADDPISKATVVFQSDGTVQSVTVTGFAAGKSSEACVKGALHKAKVPAFAEPSYSFPVTIRGTN